MLFELPTLTHPERDANAQRMSDKTRLKWTRGPTFQLMGIDCLISKRASSWKPSLANINRPTSTERLRPREDPREGREKKNEILPGPVNAVPVGVVLVVGQSNSGQSMCWPFLLCCVQTNRRDHCTES